VAAGDRLSVQVEDISPTGYRWAIEGSDPDVLAVGTETLATYPGVGAGGLRTYRLDAKGAGVAALRFKLWRKWEGDNSAIERFSVTVRVLPAADSQGR